MNKKRDALENISLPPKTPTQEKNAIERFRKLVFKLWAYDLIETDQFVDCVEYIRYRVRQLREKYEDN